MLSLYVNYRVSSFVFCFLFLKNKELLKFVPQMSLLLEETSQQKECLSFLCARLYCILDVSINLDWLTLKV